MNIVDKLYTEWAWRTKSGIPDMNNPEDKAILDNILENLSEDSPEILSLEEVINTLISKGIKDNASVSKIKNIYSSYNNQQKLNFSKYFRKLPLNQSSLTTIGDVYGDFFDAKASQGMGKGEAMIIMGIKDSQSGGTATKDIVIDGKMWEVKELSGGEYSLAKDGYITGTEYSKSYEVLKQHLNETLIEVLQEKISEEEYNLLKKAAVYMSNNSAGNNSRGFIDLTVKVCEILKNNLGTIQPDDLSYISVNGKRNLAIDPDAISSLQPNATVTLKLGDEVGQAKQSINVLKSLNWVKDPGLNLKMMEDQLTAYFEGLTGFILFKEGTPTNPTLYTAEEARKTFVVNRITKNTITGKFGKSNK